MAFPVFSCRLSREQADTRIPLSIFLSFSQANCEMHLLGERLLRRGFANWPDNDSTTKGALSVSNVARLSSKHNIS